MLEVILSIGVAALVINTGFMIVFSLSMKRMSARVSSFLESTNGDVLKSLADMKGTLDNIHNITGDVSAVTSDVRQISHSVAMLEKSLRDFLEQMKNELSASVEAHAAGLKAGIMTGAATLARNLQERSDNHEGRTEK